MGGSERQESSREGVRSPRPARQAEGPARSTDCGEHGLPTVLLRWRPAPHLLEAAVGSRPAPSCSGSGWFLQTKGCRQWAWGLAQALGGAARGGAQDACRGRREPHRTGACKQVMVRSCPWWSVQILGVFSPRDLFHDASE